MSNNLLFSVVFFENEVVVIVAAIIDVIGDWGINGRIVGRVIRSSASRSSSSSSIVSGSGLNFVNISSSYFVWASSYRVLGEKSSVSFLLFLDDFVALGFSHSLGSRCVDIGDLLI